MRTTLVLSLAIAAIAGAASAQTARNLDAVAAKTEARENDPSYRAFERQLSADLERRKSALAATGVLSDVSAVEPLPPPLHWTGTREAWRLHMTRCQTRYKSYDAQTDMYYATPSERRRCTL